MTLCCLIFDIVVVFGMHMLKFESFDIDAYKSKLAEVARFLLTLSKLGGLAVSAAWVITDLLLVASAAPGQGTLILGSIATVASLLVLLVEFATWIRVLPKAVERFGIIMRRSKVMLTPLGNFDNDEQLVKVKQ